MSNQAGPPGQLLITGASRGIGRAVCLLPARACSILGVYRSDHQAAQSLLADVGLLAGVYESGAQLSLLAADLATDEGIQRLVQHCQAESMRFSGAVFNAGINLRAGFQGPGARADLRAELEHNLASPLLLLSNLLDADLLQPGASLVFISTNLVRHAVPDRVGYAASKAGLEAAVRQLCLQLGPRGIRVNAVAPGLIRTDMTQHMSGQLLAEYAAQTPLGRVGEPLDVALAVDFLLGEGASYISGQVLEVDGGWGVR